MQSKIYKLVDTFTVKERKIFDALTSRSKTPGAIPVEVLFRLVRPEWCPGGKAIVSRRRQHMYLGSIICRMNVKLQAVDRAVVPGLSRGTYRYVRLKT